jgi:hypothetical protein
MSKCALGQSPSVEVGERVRGCIGLQVGKKIEISKLSELDYSCAFLAAISIFACNETDEIDAIYQQHLAAMTAITETSGIRLLACRLFSVGPEAAVMRCRAAVRVNKKMEGLVAMEAWEVEGSMLSFCMLDFASCLLMNIADTILRLRYNEMSLETPVDAAFRCAALWVMLKQ